MYTGKRKVSIFKSIKKIIGWVQKITIAPLKNGLSLNFTLRNIESAAISIKKTMAAHGWVHLPF